MANKAERRNQAQHMYANQNKFTLHFRFNEKRRWERERETMTKQTRWELKSTQTVCWDNHTMPIDLLAHARPMANGSRCGRPIIWHLHPNKPSNRCRLLDDPIINYLFRLSSKLNSNLINRLVCISQIFPLLFDRIM